MEQRESESSSYERTGTIENILFGIYDDYIRYLKGTYPKITDNDCIYCCLKLCEFDDQTIAYCFGNVSKQIVAQRRLRLKKNG